MQARFFPRPLALSLLGVVAAALAGCVTTVNGLPPKVPQTGPWLEASSVLRQQIDDEIERLPWTHGTERIEQIQWFATVGEPAYPRLLELVQDDRATVAGSALAALGATGDSRLVPALREATQKVETDPALRYERARTFLRLGDWRDAPVLIEGMRSETLLTRALCAQTLFETTGERFGYDAKDAALVRDEAVRRWESWWKDREREGILSSNK